MLLISSTIVRHIYRSNEPLHECMMLPHIVSTQVTSPMGTSRAKLFFFYVAHKSSNLLQSSKVKSKFSEKSSQNTGSAVKQTFSPLQAQPTLTTIQ